MVFTVEVFDAGDTVVCDLCSDDYTNSDAKGGFLFQSKGVCPACAPRFEELINKYDEQSFIKARAGADESFRDFILRIRGGNNLVTITSFTPEQQ